MKSFNFDYSYWSHDVSIFLNLYVYDSKVECSGAYHDVIKFFLANPIILSAETIISVN